MDSKELKYQRQLLIEQLKELRSERDLLAARLAAVEKEITEIDSIWRGGKLERLTEQIAAAEWREWAETLPRVVWVDSARAFDRDYRVEKVTAKTMTIVNPENAERRFVCHFNGRGMPYPIDVEKTLAGVKGSNETP